MSDPIRLAILASGNGSNLQVFIDTIAQGKLDAEIVAVISDNPNSYALSRAKNAGISAYCVDRKEFNAREAFEDKLVKILKGENAELIILAGFMRLLSDSFLNQFKDRVINIHPSLLPAFPGLDAQLQALNYGVKVTGCTVHFVDEGMDTGPIILQAVVPVLASDTREELAKRIQKEEHHIFPEAVRLYRQGRLKIVGRKVKILRGE